MKLVGKGKEIYSPDIENAKGKIRLSDIEPYAVQSVSEFDSCIEEWHTLKSQKHGCWLLNEVATEINLKFEV